MLSWRRLALLAAGAIGTAVGQPALTTIQDILYRADGTRFTGTMFIRYNSFQGGDLSNIATANLTLPIVNGTLRVQLVPTTTASAGAQYTVTYNSRGINQFTEIWSVPPSTIPLRVRDVRVSTGVIIGPPPVLAPVQIGDVTGLVNELAVRTMKGVGFGIGRAAVINQAGQIDAASGNLGDCVRVDGSSGPCGGGGGGGGGSFADAEIPAGVVNGSNAAFTLASTPSPAGSLQIYRNGLLQRQSADYQISGNAITFFLASIPQSGDLLVASYRFANPNDPLSSLAAPQVICSSTGSATSGTVLIELGSCTIPAALLGAGDRLEIQFQYGHTGATSGFTGAVKIGGTTVASRPGGATEALLAGHTSFGIYGGGQAWDTQTWGIGLSLLVSAGTAGENTAVAVRVSLQGQMAGTTSDSVFLRNFTVIRYPAQANP
ncbi:MAG: hypothetical protein JWO19_5060 [Bryobacterales bacterium]|nr:hypothetical protein [Bryobacterales bacterium]